MSDAGPNGTIDSNASSCDSVEGCFTDAGTRCKDDPNETCGTAGGSRPCAIYDLDEAAAGNSIGALDFGRFRQLSGTSPGPRCAACTGAGSVPLPCTPGTAGACF